jgi:hypothetical protein
MALCSVDQCEDKVQQVKLNLEDLACCAKALKALGVVLQREEKAFLESIIA